VPCDFVLIGALNTNDMDLLLPPLRSRILGNGYEVLLHTTMPDTAANRKKMYQFVAQEIRKDGRIPHADRESVELIIEESARRAKNIDDSSNSLTLRLRELSSIIKVAGDLTVMECTDLITPKHIKLAIKKSRAIEDQLYERYDNWWKASRSDFSTKRPTPSGASEVA